MPDKGVETRHEKIAAAKRTVIISESVDPVERLRILFQAAEQP